MQVIYPGLVSHPNHAVATSQVRTYACNTFGHFIHVFCTTINPFLTSDTFVIVFISILLFDELIELIGKRIRCDDNILSPGQSHGLKSHTE